jgi:hypothetical protein
MTDRQQQRAPRPRKPKWYEDSQLIDVREVCKIIEARCLQLYGPPKFWHHARGRLFYTDDQFMAAQYQLEDEGVIERLR